MVNAKNIHENTRIIKVLDNVALSTLWLSVPE